MAAILRQFLLTGVNGRLGSELVRVFKEEALIRPRETFDLTNLALLDETISSLKPKTVINAAGFTDLEAAQSPAMRKAVWNSNVASANNLVKVCAKNGVPLIHFSCDQIYGADETRRTPYSEIDPAGPINFLGQTKLASEHAILGLAQRLPAKYWAKGFRFWILRVPHLLERPGHGHSGFLQQLLEIAGTRRGDPIEVPNDVICSIAYTPHIAREVHWLVRNPSLLTSGTYNIASLGGVSIHDMANRLSTYVRGKVQLELVPYRSHPHMRVGGSQFDLSAKYTVLDCAKYESRTGRRLPSWQDTVQEFAREWLVRN